MSGTVECQESLELPPALWQRAESRAIIVLEETFSWLDGKDLARAGATCRLWREVAAMPTLWRHLMLREEVETQYGGQGNRRWRQQYVCAHAPWDRTERLRVGALALHGALSPAGDRLALAFADASVSVWIPEKNMWVELWHCDLRETRGWTSATRVQWARGGHRLLVAGPVALAEPGSAWELIVLRFDERGAGRIASRARCGTGAAGCWVNATGDAFLSLEPLLLAPGVAITSVWLNAATQETESEYAGVTSCLFRIFNEGGAHLSHVIVAESLNSIEAECFESHNYVCVLLATWGKTLGAWSLDRSRPIPMEVRASDSLPDRVRLVRERAMLPGPEPVELDEAAVRALCAAPLATCALPAPPLGLVLHDRPGEPRLWISMSDGSVMGFSTPDLIPLRTLSPGAATAPLVLHYVQPAISDLHFASPQGSLSGTVCVWAMQSAGSCTMQLLEHGSPAAVAMFAKGFPPTLLILAGDELHVWKSRATPQLDINFAEDPVLHLKYSVDILKM